MIKTKRQVEVEVKVKAQVKVQAEAKVQVEVKGKVKSLELRAYFIAAPVHIIHTPFYRPFDAFREARFALPAEIIAYLL